MKSKISEQNVIENLQKKILEKVKVEFSYGRPSYSLRNYMPDCLISREGSHIAVVDAKLNFDSLPRYQELYKKFALDNGYLYFIVATEDECKIFETTHGLQGTFVDITFDDLAQKIYDVTRRAEMPDKDYDYLGEFKEIIKNSANEFEGDNSDRKSNLESFADNLGKNDIMLKDGSLQFVDSKKEDEFFSQLFEEWDGGLIYRYTYYMSLFRTLNDQMQSMCCLVGMNDKSEVYYADDYLGLTSTGKTDYDYRQENSYFILSCVEDREDEDLTMWRLYGDKTEGVRISYHPQNMPVGFRFLKIFYEDTYDHHPGLEFIKAIIEHSLGNFYFRLNRYSYWKHFFKPYDYSVEKEVRLMCEKSGANNPQTIWIKGDEFSIAVPLVLIPLSKFPLHIEAVKLGPNMKEREVNKLQIMELCRERGVKNSGGGVLSVDNSRIKHYRI